MKIRIGELIKRFWRSALVIKPYGIEKILLYVLICLLMGFNYFYREASFWEYICITLFVLVMEGWAIFKLYRVYKAAAMFRAIFLCSWWFATIATSYRQDGIEFLLATSAVLWLYCLLAIWRPIQFRVFRAALLPVVILAQWARLRYWAIYRRKWIRRQLGESTSPRRFVARRISITITIAIFIYSAVIGIINTAFIVHYKYLGNVYVMLMNTFVIYIILVAMIVSIRWFHISPILRYGPISYIRTIGESALLLMYSSIIWCWIFWMRDKNAFLDALFGTNGTSNMVNVPEIINIIPQDALDILYRLISNPLNLTQEIAIGVAGAFWNSLGIVIVGIIFAWFFRLYKSRPRHIIENLEYIKSASEENFSGYISPVALSFTQQLAMHMQRGSRLLLLRQIERLKVSYDRSLTIFATKGLDSNTIEQLDAISGVELPGLKFPRIGTIINVITLMLAETRISGKLFRNADNSIDIWMTVSSRKRDHPLELVASLPMTSYISDVRDVSSIAEELALQIILYLSDDKRIASNWQSLKLFIDGLEASSNQNWWHAISKYQQATAIEEAVQNPYPVGYYHIGATLLLQGEIDSAINYLDRAASYSPVSATTHYMTALALQEKNNVLAGGTSGKRSASIRSALERALRVDTYFSEAHHLLGLTYYKGISRINVATIDHDRRDNMLPERENSNGLYNAEMHFAQSHRLYERSIMRNKHQHLHYSDNQQQYEYMMREYLVATHHWADSLRSLMFHEAAFQLYHEANEGFPNNAKNAADQIITRRIQEDWDRGLKFIEMHVHPRASLTWSSEVQLYMAMIFAGLKRRGKNNVSQALTYIDIAIFLRPRFIFQREDTSWYDLWSNQFREEYKSESNIELLKWNDASKINDMMRMWIIARIDSYVPSSKSMNGKEEMYYHMIRNSVLYKLHERVRKYKLDISEVIFDQEKNYAMYSLSEVSKVSDILYKKDGIFDCWSKIYNELNVLDKIPSESFMSRWKFDIFMQMSLLLCSSMCKINRYDDLLIVSQKSYDICEGWIKSWFSNVDLYISSHLTRYYLITLASWKSLAQFYTGKYEGMSSEHVRRYGLMRTRLNVLQKLRELAEANRLDQHPLFLFVQGIYYRSCGNLSEALSMYSRLIDVVDSYEQDIFHPLQTNEDTFRNNFFGEQKKFSDMSIDIQLRYVEKASGQKQFYFLVHQARTYNEMSDIAFVNGDMRSSINYLFKAISSSPYSDYDLHLFITLIERLVIFNAFESAFSTVKEARSRLAYYPQDVLRTSSLLVIDVLECIILSRLERYDESLMIGKRIIHSRKMPMHRDINIVKSIKQCIDVIGKNGMLDINQVTEEAARVSSAHIDFSSIQFQFNRMRSLLRENVNDEDEIIESSYEYKCLLQSFGYHVSRINESTVNYDLLRYIINSSEIGITSALYLYDSALQRIERGISVIIYQMCELHNNIAFNLAALKYDFKDARIYVLTAIQVMKDMEKEAYKSPSEGHMHWTDRIQDRLAQYYDTLAWIYYQSRYIADTVLFSEVSTYTDSLIVAEKHLRASINYSQTSAIPQYHLALVLTERAEGIKSDMSNLEFLRTRHDAQMHWHRAQSLDITKRIDAELRVLRNRIDALFAP